jgi:uncharacterized protein YjiS (DUF1127 family)
MPNAHTQSGSAGTAYLTDRIADALRAVWTAHQRRRRHNRTIGRLHDLSDRSLADIGIDRSEIEAVVRSGGRHRTRRDR